MAAQQRVELFSGRVKKIKPTEVSEQRYDFLKLSEAEPDLGVPETTDSADVRRVLLTDKYGKRYWSDTLQIDDNGDFQATGQIQAEAFHTERIQLTDQGIEARFYGEDITLDTAGDLTTTGLVKFSSAMGVQIGQPDQGALVSRAVAMNTATPVSRGMAQMNFILGKLVPKPPPNFPKLKNGNSQILSILGVSSYRMCNFTQTDRTPGQNNSVAGGTVVNQVLRTSSYVTSTINDCGPGDRGTVTIYKNGVAAGSKTLTPALQESENDLSPVYLLGRDNGTYGDLVITDDQDYSRIAVPAISPLFWQTFDATASGSVQEGWNEVYIRHNNLFPETVPATTGTTNTAVWYYDASAPGSPEFTNVAFTPTSATLTYSSGIPHYANTTTFTLSFDIAKLSGDMYPVSDTFITSGGGGAFNAPTPLTYTSAGITTPLPRNYLASSTLSLSTIVTVKSGVGLSNAPVTLQALNSYGSTTQNFTPSGGVLFKTGTSNTNTIEETNIAAAAGFGSGSASAYRIVNPGSGDTPSFTASAAAFNSQSGTIETYDAVVVGQGNQAVLKHDDTDYSTGFLPVGPNRSGQAANQYFTFAFVRGAVSKFNINITGTIRGLWVAVPAGIGTNNGLNGWLRMDQPYAGSGVPGTGTGGNGSNGCSLGGVVTLGSNVTQSRTCTFGTLSTSGTATQEVYIRIKLQAGDVVTALTLSGATN